MIRTLALACALVFGCGEKKKQPVENGESQPPAVDSSDANTSSQPAKQAEPPAKADAHKRTAPPAAYRAALRRGRKLAKQNKLEEAAAAFRDALAVIANDPRALSELSWVLFRAKDLPGARDAARKSISKASGNLKAASLYNLGRTLEAGDDKDGAADAYRESLALRPNAIVAKRLAAITNEASGALAPRVWNGPYLSFAELCDEVKNGMGPDFKCGPHVEDVSVESIKAPYLEVKAIRLGEPDGESEGRLAVKLDSGWFVSDPYFELIIPGMWAAGGKVTAAAVETIGGGPVLRINVERSEDARFENFSGTQVVYCGVGESKELACTPFVVITEQIVGMDPFDEDASEEEDIVDVAFDVQVASDGTLTVEIASGRPGDFKGQIGREKLVFP